MRRGGSVLAVVAASALLLPASAQADTEQADKRLERALSALVTMPDGPPGVSAVVQRGRKPRFHTAGVADKATSAPFRIDDHMRIASVTKAFTGAVTLRLVESGRLSLRSTIGAVLPELPPEWHGVTVHNLLDHTSGVPNFGAVPEFQEYLGDHLTDYTSPQQLIGFAALEPPDFAPGTRYEYSNTGAIVLALMAERVARAPFPEVLSRLVLKPLGLRATSFPVTSLLLPDPYVAGYQYDAPGQPQEEVTSLLSPSAVWAAGAIVSTPRDLNTFIRAWAGGGLLRSPALRRAQTRFLLPFTGGEPIGPGVNRAGLALYRYRLPCGVVFGHTGNTFGYTQWAAASPDGTRSAVVSINLQMSIPDKALPEVGAALRRTFRRAACAALAGRR